MRQLVWVDMYSGLGGASQPAKDRGWRVIRIDREEKFRPDIVADLSAGVPLKPERCDCGHYRIEHERSGDSDTCDLCGCCDPVYSGIRPDVLWASFPCQDFSKWGLRCFFPEPPNPDLTLALATKAIIDEFKPKAWVAENVLSSRPFLNPIFGPPRAVTTGHVLWSNLGFLLPNITPHKGTIRTGWWGTNKRGWGPMHHDGRGRGEAQAKAAVIPYEIGLAICRAVEAKERDFGGEAVAGRR